MNESDLLKFMVVADTTQFQGKIEVATKELSSFEKAWGSVTKKITENKDVLVTTSSCITALSTAFKACHLAINNYIIAPLSGAVNGFMALGDQISKTSQRIGMSTGTLGGLKFAAEQCGANFETLTNGIKSFQNQLGAAQMGDDRAINKLSKVGLNADMFAGLDNEAQLMKVADYIKDIGDKAEQTRVSIALFGDAGFKLLPFFQEGSVGINKLITEGKDIGAVMGEDSVTAAVNLADAMNRLKTSAASVTNSLIGGLAPALSSLMDIMTFLIKYVTKFLNEWGGVAAAVAGYLIVGLNLKYHLLSISGILPKIASGIKLITAAMFSNPWLLGGAVAIGAIAAAWKLWNDRIKETEKRLTALLEASKKHQEEIEKMEKALGAAEDAELKLLQRLEEINNLEDPLSNDQIREAQLLIEELESRYGDLGLEIDATTGKIKGLAEAQEKMIAQLTEKRLVELGGQQEKLSETKLELEQRRFQADSEIRRYRGLLKDPELSEGAKSLYNDKIKQHEKERDLYNSQLTEINKQKSALLEEQTALRNGTFKLGSKGGVQGKPETWQELNKKNTAVEAENAKAKAEREEDYQKRNVQLQKDLQEARDVKKDPYTLRMEKVDRDIAEKLENLEKMKNIALQQGNMSRFNSLLKNASEIKAQGDIEKKKIQAEKVAEEQKTREAQAKERADRAEELRRLTPELKTDRLTNAETAFQRARDNQAQAILANGDVAQADEEVKSAQQELAQAIAEASGLARKKAAENLKKAQEEYDNGKKQNFDQETMLKLAKALHDAKDAYDNENEKYFNAVGQLRQENEADIADAIQTTFSTSGTFSAYGMDAAVASDIPQQTLDVLRALLDNTDDIKEEQKNNGVFTA